MRVIVQIVTLYHMWQIVSVMTLTTWVLCELFYILLCLEFLVPQFIWLKAVFMNFIIKNLSTVTFILPVCLFICLFIYLSIYFTVHEIRYSRISSFLYLGRPS